MLLPCEVGLFYPRITGKRHADTEACQKICLYANILQTCFIVGKNFNKKKKKKKNYFENCSGTFV